MMLTANMENSDVILPTQISPDVLILTTQLSTPASTILLICPGKATTYIMIRKPVHILRIPMACSTPYSNFHLPPQISDFKLGH